MKKAVLHSGLCQNFCRFKWRGSGYPRYFNIPNQKSVQGKIAALEHGQDALVFSSGMAAISCAVLSHAGAGDHVVLLDIRKIAAFAREKGITTIFDNTFATPVNQRPLARFLSDHPAVACVNYPGLETFLGHDIAREQMDRFGAMLSFELKQGNPDRFLAKLELITPAVSLGGVETTICSPCVTSHAKMTKKERERVGVTDALLRLSAGIEEIEDLKADMGQALENSGHSTHIES